MSIPVESDDFEAIASALIEADDNYIRDAHGLTTRIDPISFFLVCSMARVPVPP